jgi:hypothetical protein
LHYVLIFKKAREQQFEHVQSFLHLRKDINSPMTKVSHLCTSPLALSTCHRCFSQDGKLETNFVIVTPLWLDTGFVNVSGSSTVDSYIASSMCQQVCKSCFFSVSDFLITVFPAYGSSHEAVSFHPEAKGTFGPKEITWCLCAWPQPSACPVFALIALFFLLS